MLGVTPAWSVAVLIIPALTPLPAIPSVMSRTNISVRMSMSLPSTWRTGWPYTKEERKVVVGVDARAGDDVDVDLLVDALQGIDVATVAERGAVDDGVDARASLTSRSMATTDCSTASLSSVQLRSG